MVKRILGMDAGYVNLGEPIIIPANQYSGNYIASENGTSYFSHNSGGLKITPEEAEKKIKELQGLIIDIEDKLDLLNGKYGSLCLFCDSKIYNAKEGIIHKSYCLIKKLRNEIKEFKEIFKESD